MVYDNAVIRATKLSAGKDSCNHYSQAIHTSSGSFSFFGSPQIFKLSKLSRYANALIYVDEDMLVIYVLIHTDIFLFILNSCLFPLTRSTQGIVKLTKY